MIKRMCSKVLPVVLAFSLLFVGNAFAGKGHGQCHHKKVGFFQRLGRAIRHIGDHIKNGFMDLGVKIKYKLTGRKCRVWVCGHYDHNGRHVKGHWRYLKNCHGKPGQGNPGQGNNPGQGENPGQGGGQLPPLPPDAPPAEPTPPAEPPAEPPADQPPADQPPADQPPADQPPAEQPGQGDQGQGDQGQGGKRTLGMLMKDLVSMSSDMDSVKKQALQAKKSKADRNITFSIVEDYSLLSNDREADAKTLVKVVTMDLEKNNGQPGVFYAAFLRNISQMTKADRACIRDVLDAIKTFVKNEANDGGRNNPYETRLAELKNY